MTSATQTARQWGRRRANRRAVEAMKKDGQSPSTYSDNAATEDFSESLVMYSLSKGTPCEAMARTLFPNRYAALDKLMKK